MTVPCVSPVMGCVVGSGEAREADLGVASGNGRGQIFVRVRSSRRCRSRRSSQPSSQPSCGRDAGRIRGFAGGRHRLSLPRSRVVIVVGPDSGRGPPPLVVPERTPVRVAAITEFVGQARRLQYPSAHTTFAALCPDPPRRSLRCRGDQSPALVRWLHPPPGARVFAWLPLGLRVKRRIETIIREEMDGIGAQRCTSGPASAQGLRGHRSVGQEYGDGIFRLKRPQGRRLPARPDAHEEVFTLLVKDLCHTKTSRVHLSDPGQVSR
jgi:hypothetical protein